MGFVLIFEKLTESTILLLLAFTFRKAMKINNVGVNVCC